MSDLALFEKPISGNAVLFIREPRHAEAYFALIDANRERLREWLAWVDDVKSPEDIRSFIERTQKHCAESGDVIVGIGYDGRVAGMISLDHVDLHNGTASIGYWLGAEFEGKGLVTQACRILLRHAFEELRLNRVVLCMQPDNERSKAVATRLGFSYEGTLRQDALHYGHRVDHEVHSLLRDKWISMQEDSGVQ